MDAALGRAWPILPWSAGHRTAVATRGRPLRPVRYAHDGWTDPQPRHAVSHAHLRPAPGRADAGSDRPPRRLGPPPPRPRPAHLPRPARPPRDHPGRRRRDRGARGARGGEPGPERVRRDRRRDSSRPRLAGTENPRLRDRRDRAPGPSVRDPLRGEDAALLHQRARRPDRRGAPPAVPLPRHPARADAAAAAPALAARPGDPPGPRRAWLRRGRDAEPHQVDARGRPRLHRPEPAPAGDRLRPAAEPAAAQAAADGRRASTATSRSPAASATRTCAATASPSSPSSTSR